MNELYFITRCGAIHNLGIAMGIFSVFAFIILYVVSITTDECSGDPIFNEKVRVKIRTFAKTFLCTTIVGVLLAVFVPTKNEAYAIYGIGATIDYVKSNDKAKELPDKAIEALDKWLDSVSDTNNE